MFTWSPIKAPTQFTSLSLLALFLSPERLSEAVESRGHVRTFLRFIFHLHVSEVYARHLHAENHKGQKWELELWAVVSYHVVTVAEPGLLQDAQGLLTAGPSL